MNIDIVILAAGQGTRMRSNIPKVLHKIGGRSMLQHVVDTVNSLDADPKIHIVIGHEAGSVQSTIGPSCDYVIQEQQLGTGHAVAQALPLLTAGSKTLILYGDVPLIQADTLQEMLDAVNDDSIAVLTTELEDPSGYGRILRDEVGEVCQIIEHRDADDDQLEIDEINSGIMCVNQKHLASWLPKIENNNVQQEYYLTDLIELAVNDGIAIETPQPMSNYEVQGVNNRSQLAELERVYQFWLAEHLMAQGASLADPSRIDVRGTLTVGKDVFIDVNAVFIGSVSLGDGVVIGPNCVVQDTTIAEGTELLPNCVIQDSVIGRNCNLGPFARLRPGTVLDEAAKIGNFVEVKNSRMGEGSKASHLSYIGDTEVGSRSNIGAGTITCNYDGANKYKTILGENVFIGSNSTLVAPLEIEDDAFVAAGSTVTQTVPSKALAVGRGRQRNITGWNRPKKP